VHCFGNGKKYSFEENIIEFSHLKLVHKRKQSTEDIFLLRKNKKQTIQMLSFMKQSKIELKYLLQNWINNSKQ